jgi:hypothetical protein
MKQLCVSWLFPKRSVQFLDSLQQPPGIQDWGLWPLKAASAEKGRTCSFLWMTFSRLWSYSLCQRLVWLLSSGCFSLCSYFLVGVLFSFMRCFSSKCAAAQHSYLGCFSLMSNVLWVLKICNIDAYANKYLTAIQSCKSMKYYGKRST